LRERIKAWRESGAGIALVATQGTLHKAHMSLVAQAQDRAERVIVSIIAPLESDALSLEADRELLQHVGADVLFVPPQQEIYPFGHDVTATVDIPDLAQILEGALRPGHFAGVATVAAKLFNLIRPDVAIYGERDFQQLALIRRMVQDLFFSVAIVRCDTVRESDGLALASNNRRLNLAERARAPRLYATLVQFAKRIDAGERDYEALQRQGMQALSGAGLHAEYFAIRQAADLAPVRSGTRDLVILAAVRFHATRLIDSLCLHLVDRFL
jgi:pantoate--beta-alanine ligase